MFSTFTRPRPVIGMVTALAVAVALLTVVPGTARASLSDGAPAAKAPTVQAYTEYLRGAAATDSGAQDTLDAFLALSRPDQQRLVRYMADAESFETLLGAAGFGALGTTTLRDGDATITVEAGAVNEHGDTAGDVTLAALPPGTWRAWYRVTQTFMGVTITRLEIWVRFETNGLRITRVLSSGSGATNYNFVISISSNDLTPWLSGGRAWAETVWSGYAIYQGFGIRLDKRQTMWADNNGNVSGWLVNI